MKNVEIGLLEISYIEKEVKELLVVIKEIGLQKEVSIKPRGEISRSINNQGDLIIGYECVIDQTLPITMTGEALFHPNLVSYLIVNQPDKVKFATIEFSINSMSGYQLELEVINEDDFIRANNQFNRVK